MMQVRRLPGIAIVDALALASLSGRALRWQRWHPRAADQGAITTERERGDAETGWFQP